jgi:ATP-dependent Clp protease adaptor protein ClpS
MILANNPNLDENDFDLILVMMGQNDSEEESGVATVTRKKVKKPKLYKVLLHNDDYTTMEFVIHILKKHFGKSEGLAQDIMLQIHHEGSGLCGVYTFEIAETKVSKVMKEARREGHPLLCSFEPE